MSRAAQERVVSLMMRVMSAVRMISGFRRWREGPGDTYVKANKLALVGSRLHQKSGLGAGLVNNKLF